MVVKLNLTHVSNLCAMITKQIISKGFGNQEGKITGSSSYRASLVFLEEMKPLNRVQPIFSN